MGSYVRKQIQNEGTTSNDACQNLNQVFGSDNDFEADSEEGKRIRAERDQKATRNMMLKACFQATYPEPPAVTDGPGGEINF